MALSRLPSELMLSSDDFVVASPGNAAQQKESAMPHELGYSNRNPSNANNPSDDYPPSRPGLIVVLIALGLTVVGLGFENWSDISALAHSSRIERAFGL
jgi:hypothetical protein